jgi:hypothetical protein
VDTTRQQAEGLTAFLATMTPVNDAEAALVHRAQQTPDQVTSDILDTPADAMVAASEGTVTTRDLFTPAQIANAGTRQEQPMTNDMTPEQQANWNAHTKRMTRFKELNKLTKAQLCQMYRDRGHIWSLNPLEKWRKGEIITGIIEAEERATVGPSAKVDNQ